MTYLKVIGNILTLSSFSLLLACSGDADDEMGSSQSSNSSENSAVSSASSEQASYVRLAPNTAKINESRFCMASVSVDNSPSQSFRFERDVLQQQLLGDGLVGTLHGVMSLNQQAVFTYRSEASFFESEELSLVPANSQITTLLATVKRHDRVRINGNLLQTGDGPRHVLVQSLVVLDNYETSYNYNHKVDETLFAGIQKAKILAKVHAVIDGGKGLVLEYKDMVLPVIVDASHQSLSANFYRNDIVLVDVSIVREDNRPLHFRTDATVVDSLQRIDAMVGCHSQQATLQGDLVRFPASPIISRDVYAVKVTDVNGIVRIYTLFPGVGFKNPDAFNALFTALTVKAQAAWQSNESSALAARNYFVNPSVSVTVSGRINVVSGNQANPQIYINAAEQLNFTVSKK